MTVAALTIRDLPDEVHRAPGLRAGQLLMSMSREAGLTTADVNALER